MKDDDTQPSSMPPQPKTTELVAPDPLQIAIAKLTSLVDRGFHETRADLESVKNEGQRTNLRLTRLEMRQDDVETRLTRTSVRAKAESDQDMARDAQLAQERSAREELAGKVDALTKTQDVQLAILARLDKVTSNPTVKVIAGMLATALITWLASHGGSLK